MSAKIEKPLDIHFLLWLGLPIICLAVVLLTPLLQYDTWHKLMQQDEINLIEIPTVLFLLPAIFLGVILFVKFYRDKSLRRAKLVAIVMLLAALASLYFAGEECSWGQSYLHYQTPEGLAGINSQEEANLHNIELPGFWGDVLDGILSDVPRQVMLLLVIIGGVILPLALIRWQSKPESRESIWYWLIPNWRIVPIGIIAACSTLPEKLIKFFAPDLPRNSYVAMAFKEPAGEFKELCFALVILFYLWSIYLRTKENPNLEAA